MLRNRWSVSSRSFISVRFLPSYLYRWPIFYTGPNFLPLTLLKCKFYVMFMLQRILAYRFFLYLFSKCVHICMNKPMLGFCSTIDIIGPKHSPIDFEMNRENSCKDLRSRKRRLYFWQDLLWEKSEAKRERGEISFPAFLSRISRAILLTRTLKIFFGYYSSTQLGTNNRRAGLVITSFFLVKD